jgi:hypothetical protein
MQTVRLIVGKGKNPFSYAIKAVTDSRWSHIGLVAGDYVYESAAFKGVVKTPIAEFKKRYRGDWEIIEVTVVDADRVYTTAKSLLGCGYDYFGVFGLAFRLNLSVDKRYQCAEYIAECLGIRLDKCYKATPEGIWLYLGKTVIKGAKGEF